MPGVAFPPVGRLGLTSPPSSVLCSAKTARCPSWVASLPLASQYLGCSLALCSLTGSLAAGSSPPTPGLLVNRYPCSSGGANKETAGSPKFPNSPCDDMLRSPQTPVVSCPPCRDAVRTPAFHTFHSVGFPPCSVWGYLLDHDYTYFGAPFRSLSPCYPRLRTTPREAARGFATELLARLCSGGT